METVRSQSRSSGHQAEVSSKAQCRDLLSELIQGPEVTAKGLNAGPGRSRCAWLSSTWVATVLHRSGPEAKTMADTPTHTALCVAEKT